MADITINNRNVRYIELEEARAGLTKLVLDNLPRTDREDWLRRDVENSAAESFGRFILRVELSRGNGAVDARLNIHLRPHLEFEGQPGAENFAAFKVETEIGWASTRRSIANATAAVKLYQDVIELAALIEATYGDGRVIGQVKPAA